MTIEEISRFLSLVNSHVRLEYIVFGSISYLNIGIFWARFYYATMKKRSMILGTNVSSWNCDRHYTAKNLAYISVFLWPAFIIFCLLCYLLDSIGFFIKTVVINDTKEEEDNFAKKGSDYRRF